jgi:archaellum biogenesis protein FlaJ (TadC family)
LHHIAITLKTSGTIESALREVSKIDYGPITDGIKRMTREISEGKSFEDAFRDYALRSRSNFLQKCAVIIIAARKSGGSLFNTLTATAEDIRALSNLRRERRAKTFMQFAFILVAGCIIAPFVFGILKSVLEILFTVGSTAEASASLLAFFDILFKSYLVIEASLGTLGAVQVREGKWTKGIIYIPISVIATYVIYLVVSSTFMSMLGI